MRYNYDEGDIMGVTTEIYRNRRYGDWQDEKKHKIIII